MDSKIKSLKSMHSVINIYAYSQSGRVELIRIINNNNFSVNALLSGINYKHSTNRFNFFKDRKTLLFLKT